jgi:HlyD family secretion protein
VSEVRPDIDLAGLSRSAAQVPPPRRSPWRIVLPALILVAFLAVLVSSLQGLFRSSVAVSVVRPRPASGGGTGAPARVVLQAAGWVEPDPFPIQVSALTAGVVREVHVLEAARVARGDKVATLVDEDARLEVIAAEAALADAQAARDEARARANNAQRAFEVALDVTENEATARAELEGRRAEVLQREAAAASGVAGVRVARDELALQKELLSIGAVEQRVVDLAEARVAEAEGALEQLRAETSLARAGAEKALAQHTRAARDVELRLDDKLALETANAAFQGAEARVAASHALLDTARLRLARTVVTAPCDGVVLERLAMPGTALDPAGSALVCTLYDPKNLRVRVDVPQAEVFKLQAGGRAEILIEARAGRPYAGEISRIVDKADIQKVTLQVHVRIEDGDERLRPEMLAQARFLAQAAPDAGAGTAAAQSVEIPAHVVDDGRSVWIVDGTRGTAKLRAVTLGARTGDWVEVSSGLDISDKVIDRGRQGLAEGARVRIEAGP